LDALALSVPVLSYRQNILSDIFGDSFKGFIPRNEKDACEMDIESVLEGINEGTELAKSNYLDLQKRNFDSFVDSI